MVVVVSEGRGRGSTPDLSLTLRMTVVSFHVLYRPHPRFVIPGGKRMYGTTSPCGVR